MFVVKSIELALITKKLEAMSIECVFVFLAGYVVDEDLCWCRWTLVGDRIP